MFSYWYWAVFLSFELIRILSRFGHHQTQNAVCRLVYFCHGATGLVLMLCNLKEALPQLLAGAAAAGGGGHLPPEKELTSWCLEAAKKSGETVWEHGLPKKVGANNCGIPATFLRQHRCLLFLVWRW